MIILQSVECTDLLPIGHYEILVLNQSKGFIDFWSDYSPFKFLDIVTFLDIGRVIFVKPMHCGDLPPGVHLTLQHALVHRAPLCRA